MQVGQELRTFTAQQSQNRNGLTVVHLLTGNRWVLARKCSFAMTYTCESRLLELRLGTRRKP
jgi:hypothetical protein